MRAEQRPMRNVIVFAIGRNLYALELRWVREVVTLPHVTRVPTAPRGVLGAVNVRGAIVPVIDVEAVTRRQGAGRAARAGDGSILLEVDDALCAIRIDNVEEVTTLHGDAGRDRLSDTRGRAVTLIDPETIVRRAIAEEPARGDARVD
jgi:chemotaxis signal transduction protein